MYVIFFILDMRIHLLPVKNEYPTNDTRQHLLCCQNGIQSVCFYSIPIRPKPSDLQQAPKDHLPFFVSTSVVSNVWKTYRLSFLQIGKSGIRVIKKKIMKSLYKPENPEYFSEKEDLKLIVILASGKNKMRITPGWCKTQNDDIQPCMDFALPFHEYIPG